MKNIREKKSMTAVVFFFIVLLMSLAMLSVKAHAASKTIYTGRSVSVSVSKKATWKASKTGYVKITTLNGGKTAKLTGVKAGSTTVTAKVGRTSYKISVTVKKAQTSASARTTGTSSTGTAVTGTRDSVFKTTTGKKVTGHYVTTMANSLVTMTNQYRSSLKLKTLRTNSTLVYAAKIRSYESAVKFSHTRPNGKKYNTINRKVMKGENLAYGYNTASSCMRAWKKSASHNANLKSKKYTKIGIAVVAVKKSNGTYMNYIAQEFG